MWKVAQRFFINARVKIVITMVKIIPMIRIIQNINVVSQLSPIPVKLDTQGHITKYITKPWMAAPQKGINESNSVNPKSTHKIAIAIDPLVPL